MTDVVTSWPRWTRRSLRQGLQPIWVVQKQGAPKVWVCRLQDPTDIRLFAAFLSHLLPLQELRTARPLERQYAAGHGVLDEWRTALQDWQAQQLELPDA